MTKLIRKNTVKWASIDPGIRGGIILWEGGTPRVAMPMPLCGKDIDIQAIKDIFFSHEADEVVIEKVGGLPGQSAPAAFSFGFGVGQIVGYCLGEGISVKMITPTVWQKKFHEGLPQSLDTKDRSRMAAQRLFPSFSQALKTPRGKVIHDGMCDALGIGYAWWGKEK